MRSMNRFIALLLCSSSAAAQTTDLLQVYDLALRNDPLIAEAQSLRQATHSNRSQSTAALLPSVNATGTIGRSEFDGSSVFPSVDDPETSVPIIVDADERSRSDSWQYSVTLVQPVLRLDYWASLRHANARVAQADIQFVAAEQELMWRVAQRYFDVLSADARLQAANVTLQAFDRQLEQFENRHSAGLLASADVQEARAARDQTVTAVIEAKRARARSLEGLRVLTGSDTHALAAPSARLTLQAPTPADETRWVAVAMAQNPKLIGSRLAVDVAKQSVSIARAGHFPSIDLVLTDDRFDHRVDQTFGGTSGPADNDGHDQLVALQFSFPIFSGGGTRARVGEQVHLHRAARQRLEFDTRETERTARDAYQNVLTEIARVGALEQSVQSSRVALQSSEAGFGVGTRTTTDVLEARRQLFEAETAYAVSRYDYLLSLVRLQLAAGTLSQADLQRINSWLTSP